MRQIAEKGAQLCGRFELWHRVEFLERAGKCVREAPHRLAANSGYCGSKYNRWTSGSRVLGASSLPSMNAE